MSEVASVFDLIRALCVKLFSQNYIAVIKINAGPVQLAPHAVS